MSTGYWRVACQVCGLCFEEWMIRQVRRIRVDLASLTNEVARGKLKARPRASS